MKKLLIIAVLIFSLTGVANAQMYSDFTLPDLEGDDVTLSKLFDKSDVVLISFWASWCAPCKEEMRKMNDVYLKYKEKGFDYVALNIDNQKSIAKVKSYIATQDFAFTVLMDTEKRVFEAYGGRDEMPYSLLINKNKEIVAVHVGFKTGDEAKIEEEIKTALGIK